MAEILRKEEIAPSVFLYEIYAPVIAQKRKAGNFVIIRLSENGERIPLTIADANEEKGSITLVVQAVGKSTTLLSYMNVGDNILDVFGPLGHPTHIEKKGTVVCVGGGIGIAPLHPIAEAMKKAGNRVISILGGRNKDFVILESQMRKASDEVIICTDDGSYGEKGRVTDVLRPILESDTKVDEVVAIGPAIMMKFVSLLTKEYNVKTVVSLNPIMIDGTGMCGGCRVSVGGETKFACVDGPEFDGHLVDFDTLMNRQKAFIENEKHSHESCRLDSSLE